MAKKDFIDLRSFSREELEHLLVQAEKIKSGELDVSKSLTGKNLGLLFGVASTRTRLSFTVGARQMGAFPEYLNANDLQMKNRETVVDTAKVMDRFLDALIIRMYDMTQYGAGRETVNSFAQSVSFPVINALDDKDHPCQVMSDILTLQEKLGKDFRRKKVVLTWGYALRQKSRGVTHSMMTAASLLGMDLTLAFPEGFEPDAEYTRFAQEEVAKSGGKITFSNNMMEAADQADVVYVKSWKAIGMPDEEELKIRNAIKDQWCLSEDHFSVARPGAIYMDCLPSIRGEEVTAEVKDGPRSEIFDQAENRLHMQKAIMQYVLEANASN